MERRRKRGNEYKRGENMNIKSEIEMKDDT